ncbi:hypothetical protein Tco_0246006, partial [Tanacetum coccineum]
MEVSLQNEKSNVSDCDEDESEVRILKYDNVQQKPKQANQPRKVSENPRYNRINWNEKKTQKLGVGFQFTKKASFVCGSFNHLIKDCNFHDKRMVQKPVLNNVKKGTGQREVRPVWNNAMRVNRQNFSNSRRNFVPTVVLTKSGIVPVSAARPINTVAPKSFENKVISAVGEQGINVVKSSACWVWRPKINVLDHVSKDSKSYISLELKGYLINNGYADLVKILYGWTLGEDINDSMNVLSVLVVHHTTNGHQFTMSNRQERIGYSRANGNWYALTANPTIYVYFIEQFWQTATVETVNDGEKQITVTVDEKTIAITEASIRRHLQLANVDGISSLPNTEIFKQLTLMGYVSNGDKLTFQKGEHIPLFDSMLIQDQPGQGEGPTLPVKSQHTPIASLTTSQPTTSKPMSSQEQPSQVPTTEPIITTSSPPLYETTIPRTTSSMPYDSPLLGGNTPGSDEGSKKLNELTELCTKLSNKVTSLEEDLKQGLWMVISDDEEDIVSEDPSKQGRMTETEYKDVDVETEYEEVEYELDQTDTFQQITPTKVSQGKEQSQESSEVQLDVLSAAKILADASRERVKTYKSYTKKRSTVSSRDSTAGGLFSTAKEILSIDERIAQKLNEEEMAKAVAREEHERIDFEKDLELQKQMDEREETNIDWSIMAEQVQERQSDIIKRYQTLKKKPVSVAQARKNMMIYLKNMAGYKMGYFKGMSYDEIRPMFEKEYNKIQTLFKKDTEVEKTKTKRVTEEILLQESFKKLRTAEASRSEPIQEQPTEEPK